MVFVFFNLFAFFQATPVSFFFSFCMHGMETESVGHAISVSKVHCAIWVGPEVEKGRCRAERERGVAS